ncbi:permease-like cell division protein FtsX [Sphaerisporangium sp. NPDC049002]|uniref:permease-like cell division protein FtsX n=1 Tax=Sphaerisporangium sp. NPDC049002 TaxID=3155392 RepID=UPI0034037DAF
MLRVLLAIASLTVLLLGTSASDAKRFPEILAAPDGPWPEGGSFAVHLCSKGDAWDACGDKDVTPAQRQGIERTLRQMPRITGVHYQSKSEALALLKASFRSASVLRESDMSESFSGRLLRWSDAPAFDSVVKALPGISVTYVWPAPFWEDKADVDITLCDAVGEREPCEGRGQTTADEKAAIEAFLRRTKGVKLIYFSDRAHGLRVIKQFNALWSQVIERHPEEKKDDTEPGPSENYFESYHVKLDDPKLAPSFVDAVKHLPGVARVE